MGMESYNIMLLPKNINIKREDAYWKLCGTTDILLNAIEDDLEKLCIKVNKNKEYVFAQCIDVKLHGDKIFFQGFELRGCLSYLAGVEACYNFYEFWKNKIPLNIFILNQIVNVESSNDLYETICYMYSEKIKLFNKQYGDIELKVTSGNFYREIKKRKRWYNKLFSITKYYRSQKQKY